MALGGNPGLLGLVALLVGLALLVVRRVWGGYPASLHAGLAPREAALLQAAGLGLYPPGGTVPRSGSQADLVGYTARYLRAVPPPTRRLMRLLFFAFEQGTCVFAAPGRRGRRRFSALTPAQRVAVLEAWRSSRWFPLRLAFTSLRAILSMGYFADAEVQAQLHLTPFVVDTPEVEADGLYPPIGRGRQGLRAPDSPLDLHQRAPAGDPLRPDSPRVGLPAHSAPPVPGGQGVRQ